MRRLRHQARRDDAAARRRSAACSARAVLREDQPAQAARCRRRRDEPRPAVAASAAASLRRPHGERWPGGVGPRRARRRVARAAGRRDAGDERARRPAQPAAAAHARRPAGHHGDGPAREQGRRRGADHRGERLPDQADRLPGGPGPHRDPALVAVCRRGAAGERGALHARGSRSQRRHLGLEPADWRALCVAALEADAGAGGERPDCAAGRLARSRARPRRHCRCGNRSSATWPGRRRSSRTSTASGTRTAAIAGCWRAAWRSGTATIAAIAWPDR